MSRQPYPLYKVQKPVEGNDPERPWLFYTERHRDSPWIVPEALVPDRIKRAMGFKHKVYLYLNVTVEPTCTCMDDFDTVEEEMKHCTHTPMVEIEYIGAEGSSKKTNW